MSALRLSLLTLPLLLLAQLGLAQRMQSTLTGHVTLQGQAAQRHKVYIMALTDSLGNTDTTGVQPDSVYTDASGEFRTVQPYWPGALTFYIVFTTDCDTSIVAHPVYVTTPTTAVPAFTLCPPCTLNAAFTSRVSGANRLTVEVGAVAAQPNQYHTWHWGDGQSSYTGQATHTYARPGTYTISHDVVDGHCTEYSFVDLYVGDTTLRPVQIGGQIYAGGNCALDSVLVEFFGADPSYNVSVMSDTLCYFGADVTPGRYLVRFTPVKHSLVRAGYMPTYLGNRLQWSDSLVIDVRRPNLGLRVDLIRRDTMWPGQSRVSVRFHNNGTPFVSPYQPSEVQLFSAPMARTFLYAPQGQLLDFAAVPVPFPNLPMAVFRNLSPGQYRLQPDVPFMNAESQWVTVSAGTSGQTVDYSATVAGSLQAGNIPAAVADARSVKLAAWPNPASTSLRLQLPEGAGAGELRLLSADGRVVRSKTVQDLSQTAELSVEGLPAGLYHAQALRQGQPSAAVRVTIRP